MKCSVCGFEHEQSPRYVTDSGGYIVQATPQWMDCVQALSDRVNWLKDGVTDW